MSDLVEKILFSGTCFHFKLYKKYLRGSPQIGLVVIYCVVKTVIRPDKFPCNLGLQSRPLKLTWEAGTYFRMTTASNGFFIFAIPIHSGMQCVEHG